MNMQIEYRLPTSVKTEVVRRAQADGTRFISW
jgi:hypothetical protein